METRRDVDRKRGREGGGEGVRGVLCACLPRMERNVAEYGVDANTLTDALNDSGCTCTKRTKSLSSLELERRCTSGASLELDLVHLRGSGDHERCDHERRRVRLCESGVTTVLLNCSGCTCARWRYTGFCWSTPISCCTIPHVKRCTIMAERRYASLPEHRFQLLLHPTCKKGVQ